MFCFLIFNKITLFFETMKNLKLSLIIISFSLTLFSCSDGEGNVSSTLVAELNDSSNKLKIYESATSESVEGDIHPIGTPYRSDENGVYQSSSHTLKSTLIDLFDTKSKYVRMDNKILSMRHIDIKNESKGITDKLWIADQICVHYGLTVEHSTEMVKGYELIVLDTAKLNNNIADPSEKANVVFGKGRLLIQKGTLDLFAAELDAVSREYVTSSSFTEELYNINVNIFSLKEMAVNMEEKYGLSFKEAEWEVSRYVFTSKEEPSK